MIRYELKCASGHNFDAWFANSAAFDDQIKRGQVSCALCGCSKIEKALMVPGISQKTNRSADDAQSNGEDATALQSTFSGPDMPEFQKKLVKLREEIESSAANVGKNFANEARKMHLGDVESRAIYGEATREEAKSLVEDGVPVTRLPYLPKRND